MIEKQQLKTKVIVLLDVDGTSISNSSKFKSAFNQKLFDSLREAGCYDVYLFTHMSLNNLSEELKDHYISRPKLIEKLQEMGFTVHGVITGADKGYNQGLGRAYQDYYPRAIEMYKRMLEAEKNKELTDRLDQEIGKLKEEFMEHMNKSRKDTKLTMKGSMYEYFATSSNFNSNVSIIVLDDDSRQLKGIAEVKNSQINQERNRLLTLIEVDPRDYSKSYENQIKCHLLKMRLQEISEDYNLTVKCIASSEQDDMKEIYKERANQLKKEHTEVLTQIKKIYKLDDAFEKLDFMHYKLPDLLEKPSTCVSKLAKSIREAISPKGIKSNIVKIEETPTNSIEDNSFSLNSMQL